MFRLSAAAGLIGVLLLSACSHTTVILLPDEDGKVGAITLKAAGNSRVVDRVYRPVKVGNWLPMMDSENPLTESELNSAYAPLLKAQPARSIRYLLYFDTDSTKLVEPSRAIIPQIMIRIRSKLPTDVTIIGHTDTTGPEAHNAQLSFYRAQTVERLLRAEMRSSDQVTIKAFGSRGLLVPTPPNVDEPRNRNVEILIF